MFTDFLTAVSGVRVCSAMPRPIVQYEPFQPTPMLSETVAISPTAVVVVLNLVAA